MCAVDRKCAISFENKFLQRNMVGNGCRRFKTSHCTQKCAVTVENGQWRLISSVYESEMGSAVAGEQWCSKMGLVCWKHVVVLKTGSGS